MLLDQVGVALWPALVRASGSSEWDIMTALIRATGSSGWGIMPCPCKSNWVKWEGHYALPL